MKEQFDAEVTLLKGGGGVFDVHIDDVLVFSKHQVGRHAEPGEVMAAIISKGLG